MKPIRALVIDDEQIVLDSVTKILKEEKYEVEVTLNGREGLRKAIQNDYDIVLTDIRMPDIGGMRVLRDIKRAKPSLPVVMITGYPSVKAAIQAMKLGAGDFIEKPFTPEQLSLAVAAALRKAKTHPPEDQTVLHKNEILEVLERAATDSEFTAKLLYLGADALDEYDLTAAEKLAILTGDIHWIEEHIASLTPVQRRWLEHRVGAEIW
jgi:DNA-binding NtrC family response regulator